MKIRKWLVAPLAAMVVPLALLAADPAADPAATAPAGEHAMHMAGGEQMPAEMKLRMQVAVNAQMTAEDPATALALREELKLTDEQAQKLEEIVRQARSQAAQVLTAEQQQILKPLANAPATMKEMHSKMMEKMGAGAGYACPMHPEVRQAEPGKCSICGMNLEKKAMVCPMCGMAMGGAQAHQTEAGESKASTEDEHVH